MLPKATECGALRRFQTEHDLELPRNNRVKGQSILLSGVLQCAVYPKEFDFK